VAGGCKRLHNELHNFYASQNIVKVIKSRRMTFSGHVARMGEIRNAYKIFVENPEGKRPLGRPRHRWEDNIVADLRETRWKGVDWIHLAHEWEFLGKLSLRRLRCSENAKFKSWSSGL
jgi:hypothetical protein